MGENRQNSGTHRSSKQPYQVSVSTPLNAFEITLLVLCVVIFITANIWAHVTRTAQQSEASTVIQTADEEYDISVLNSATYDDFIAVKGIGDSKATNILKYRELLGGFTNHEQLKDISGIGEKTYAEIISHFYGEEAQKDEQTNN